MTLVLPQPNSKPRPPATVLQGPADADAFRVKVGRNRERHYIDPLPGCELAEATTDRWPSVSRIKKAKPFEFGAYVAMKRLAKEYAESGIEAGLGYDRLYETFKTIDRVHGNEAQNRGKHLHKAAEQKLYGLPVDMEGPGSAYIPALLDWFEVYQPTLYAAEVVCINRTLGYGGTADGAVWINGKLYLIDWKSRGEDADHGAYPEDGAQLAAYANADYWIVADGDGGAKRIPVPDLDGLLIMSAKPSGVQVYPIDPAKGYDYWQEMFRWHDASESDTAHILDPWPTKRSPVQAVLDATEHRRPTAQQARVLAGKAPGVVATSAPRKPAPDEGEPADPSAVEALQRTFAGLSDNAKLAMKQVAAEALEAERPISVAQNPSVRRFEIARLLIAWVSYSGDTDDGLLREVLTIVLGTDAASQPGVPLGAAVSLLDPATASRCTQIFDALAAGAALGVDDAGRPVLLAA